MRLSFAFILSCSLHSVLFFALGLLSLLTYSSLFMQGKSQTLSVKRKAESEEEKEESPSVTAVLPARSSPVTDSPKNMEEKSGLGGEVQRRALLVCANEPICIPFEVDGAKVTDSCAVNFPDKSDPAAIATPNTTSSEGASVTPTAAPTPNLAMVSRQMGDSKPPQAIVKPQILTHIIEGFVIQEGAEPFPVGILCCWGRRCNTLLGGWWASIFEQEFFFPMFQVSFFQPGTRTMKRKGKEGGTMHEERH